MNIIETYDLKKSYGNIEAVKGISFHVKKGQIFAFLGCNGAGKSTTIDILCTTLKPDHGQVYINGHLLQKEDELIQHSIGIVFQQNMLDDDLTVEENLKVRGSLYGLKKDELKNAVSKIMKEMNIERYSKRFYGTLSGGQRRLVDFARALLHQPKILFLDEPTTGLDPQTRRKVWKKIYELKKQTNMTVFLTTHYMEEATLADYLVIMDDGKIVAQGTPTEICRKYTKDKLKIVLKDMDIYEELVSQFSVYPKGGSEITILLNQVFDALSILETYKHKIKDFEIIRGSLEDAFVKITGKELSV